MRIRHTAVRRGRRVVLHEGELTLPGTGNVAVIGANGAGKTTLFLAMAGALRPRSHDLRLTHELPAPRIFYMPQEPALPSWAPPDVLAQLYGQDLAEAVRRLPGFRLEEVCGASFGQLSGGQRQVLMLALALTAGADITLLDEPLANLDLPRRHAALQALAGPRPGITFISSQAVADVIDCCSWYVVLRQGRYAFSGPVEELLGAGWRTDPARHGQLETRLLALSGFAPVA